MPNPSPLPDDILPSDYDATPTRLERILLRAVGVLFILTFGAAVSALAVALIQPL